VALESMQTLAGAATPWPRGEIAGARREEGAIWREGRARGQAALGKGTVARSSSSARDPHPQETLQASADAVAPELGGASVAFRREPGELSAGRSLKDRPQALALLATPELGAPVARGGRPELGAVRREERGADATTPAESAASLLEKCP
jgi:hypothetical protein